MSSLDQTQCSFVHKVTHLGLWRILAGFNKDEEGETAHPEPSPLPSELEVDHQGALDPETDWKITKKAAKISWLGLCFHTEFAD